MNNHSYEILDERFGARVKMAEPVTKVADGCMWSEGPVYSPVYESLIWSDIPNDRQLRWDEFTQTTSVFQENHGRYTNGSTMDRQGRIVSCCHGSRNVIRYEHDGSVTVLADQFGGKKFNSPNDVVVKSDGSIWFTDPAYGIKSDYEGYQASEEIGGQHVYRVDDASGKITQVTDDFVSPNGLAFNLDESKLFIVDSGTPRNIRSFDVSDDGKLSGGEVFAESTSGVFDGFRFDNAGNIWTSVKEGVHCYASDGTLIGKILVPETVANVCFGGTKRNILYITASTGLYKVRLTSSGPKLF